MRFTISADGGARGNPGLAGAGAIICDELGNVVGSVSKFLGRQTNNYAEYEAVILALEALSKLVPKYKWNETMAVVKLDSELVVKQMRGEYKTKNAGLKDQRRRLLEIASTFGAVSFVHIRREENSDADALANSAMDRGN